MTSAPPEPQSPDPDASHSHGAAASAVPEIPPVPAWRFPLAYPAALRRTTLLAVVSCVSTTLFLVVAVLAATGWQSSFRLDHRVAERANDAIHEHPAYEEVVDALSGFGDIVVVAAVSGVVLLVLLWTRRWWSTVFLMVSVAGGSVFTALMKQSVERPRPQSQYGLAADSPSFPSGHTSGTALLCLTLLVLVLPWEPSNRWRLLTVLAVGTPVVIGATRVLLAVHYLSDVVGGLLLATGVVSAALLVTRPWRDIDGLRRRVALDGPGEP